jgi:nicotinamide mononucleotide (NMN) deamidase PncC
MKRVLILLIAGGTLAITASAGATSAQNSIQPSKIRFGTVVSGAHPTKMATLHNGTGTSQTIGYVGIAGSGGYKFTLARGTTCLVGVKLAPKATCQLNVRVHTKATGWWRSVLRVTYASGWNNSASIQAHIVP